MMTCATALRARRLSATSYLALGLGLLPTSLLSEGQAQYATAQERDRGTQEEIASCRVVNGETGVSAGRVTIGACARAIQAGSGIGTWGLYEFEVDRDGRVQVNGEDLGVLPRPEVPATNLGWR
jgi:hypothetical protein